MIADELGVTKAAVYHQFKAKEDLAIAVTERELLLLEDAVEAAEEQPDNMMAREVLLDRVIDLAVESRGLMGLLQFDPVIVRLVATHQPFLDFITRLFGVLIGEEEGGSPIPAVMLAGAISVAVTHPIVAEVDDATLRSQMRKTARRILASPADGP
jgi:AcrR family transcriptional regulator